MTAHSAAERGAGDKRERILTAAERIFARHGFFAAKVSDVAKEAGVADGTIYLYFKSKDDLLISLFERRMQQVNETLAGAVKGKSPREQLRSLIRTYLQMVHDEPTAAEVLTIELRQSSKFMKEYENPVFADFLRLLGGIIAAAQDKGEITTPIPPQVAARMIFGMLDELSLSWVLAKKKFDIVRAADWVISLVTNGLGEKK
jgi:TetR/AcrR family fatty acid metabolism transcriptional regulator